METITEIRKWLIYFWTMSENRSKTGERKKINACQAHGFDFFFTRSFDFNKTL